VADIAWTLVSVARPQLLLRNRGDVAARRGARIVSGEEVLDEIAEAGPLWLATLPIGGLGSSFGSAVLAIDLPLRGAAAEAEEGWTRGCRRLARYNPAAAAVIGVIGGDELSPLLRALGGLDAAATGLRLELGEVRLHLPPSRIEPGALRALEKAAATGSLIGTGDVGDLRPLALGGHGEAPVGAAARRRPVKLRDAGANLQTDRRGLCRCRIGHPGECRHQDRC